MEGYRVIVDDNSHVLAKCYDILPYGRRYPVPKSDTVRTKQRFVLKSISFLNR